MKIVLTGGNGFIGTKLSSYLKNLGEEVKIIDKSGGVDLLHYSTYEHEKQVDLVIHLASMSFIPDSFKYPAIYYNTNIQLTVNALELCRNNDAKFIYISSYVYGIPQYLPIDENHPISALNPYSQSKIIGEIICNGYFRDFNIPILILRPFNIYGPGQNSNFLIPSIINQLNSGLVKLKDKRPKRDYLYIDDFIKIIIKLIYNTKSNNELINIGSGVSYSVEEIVNTIISLSKKNVIVEYSNEHRQNEVLDLRSDNSKLFSIIGEMNFTPLLFGLNECLI